MADKKLSALDAVTDVADADEFLLARSGASKKITGANLKAGVAGGSSSLSQTFAMTAAEIKASVLTPHTVLPAQGAGTLIVPVSYVFRLSAGAVPYVSGAALDLVWGGLDLNVLSNLDVPDAVLYAHGTQSAGIAEGGIAADYLDKPVQFAANLRGVIADASVNLAGSGYAVGDTGTIDDGSPNATYRVETVGAEGTVSTFTVTDPGGDYSLAVGRTPTVWATTPGGAQPGAGSGFEVAVTSVDASGAAGDCTLSGVIYYEVADLT